MTNRILTALTIRIAGIFLFIKIFDHFGSYFFSIYTTAIFARFEEQLGEHIDKFYFTGTFLTIANIGISLFLFLKAEWISKKLIKEEKEIKIELNSESLTKVIIITTGIVWLATSIYLFPDFFEYCIDMTKKLNGNESVELPNFSLAKYLLRTTLSVLMIFKINRISELIIKRI